MKIKRLIGIGLVMLSVQVSAQTLLGRTFLGISPTDASSEQVTIARVINQSTASDLGLMQGDQLVSLNNKAIGSFSTLLPYLSELAVGDTIELAIKRQGKVKTLKGKMRGRLQETSQYANVDYQQVVLGEDLLRTIVYKPNSLKNGEKAPAIFFIQGYTCSSIDYGLMPNVSGKLLLEQFAQAGYVVYRIEKFGIGDSQGPTRCDQVDFSTEAKGFVQGLKALKAMNYVDENQVYLWGHSLGVLYAPVVAEQESVAGIVGYGGVYKSWYQYLLDIYQKQSVEHFNVAPEQAKQNVMTVKPLLNAWLNSDATWQEIEKNPELKSALASNLVPIQGEQVFHRHYQFFRDLNSYDFAHYWQNINVPVLMLHGSLDIQAIDEQWAKDIAKTVNNTSKVTGDYFVFEGAEHGFMRYDNKAQYQAARATRPDPAQENTAYDPRIADKTIHWLKKLGE